MEDLLHSALQQKLLPHNGIAAGEVIINMYRNPPPGACTGPTNIA
jgi:hypothetical protein